MLYSGDTGFYSGASGLLTPLRVLGIPARVYPAFQHPAAFSGAGPTVAGLEAGLGPWLRLRPGGRVHDEPFGVLPHRRH